jgi:hypothetical protein
MMGTHFLKMDLKLKVGKIEYFCLKIAIIMKQIVQTIPVEQT